MEDNLLLMIQANTPEQAIKAVAKLIEDNKEKLSLDEVIGFLQDSVVEPISDGRNREADENYIQHFKYLNDPRGHLRDAFAMAALGGCLARPPGFSGTRQTLALTCYEMADAMLEAR